MSEATTTRNFLQIAKCDGATMLRVGYTLVAILVSLSLLKWYGFTPWTITDGITLVSSIQWAHTIPLAIVALLICFRTTVAALIEKTTEAGYGDGGFYFKFDAARLRRQELAITSAKVTLADVKSLMREVPGMNLTKVDEESPIAHVWLLRNGITTKRMLEDLVAAKELFNILSQLYVSELGRPKDAPLDAVAVATWGASLFTFGPTDNVIAAIKEKIQSSPEARQHRAASLA